MNITKEKRTYQVLSFYLDRTSGQNGMFKLEDISTDEAEEMFGIDVEDYLNDNDFFTMRTIMKLMNDILNTTNFNIISVSEDDYSIKYHLLK